ncbi:hypothetical protein [Streptomyces bathyalis]|uniref:hypothetical protein n=1 Tax=Streptomyces bathyalis TaxID=2710756 RepID=UPI0031B59E0F
MVQVQSRAASATPVHMTQADALEATSPQVCDDMTIEAAPSVMDSARTGHLLVSVNDGLRTGPATQAQLVAVRDSSEHADRAQLRDILGDRGPSSSTRCTTADSTACH